AIERSAVLKDVGTQTWRRGDAWIVDAELTQQVELWGENRRLRNAQRSHNVGERGTFRERVDGAVDGFGARCQVEVTRVRLHEERLVRQQGRGAGFCVSNEVRTVLLIKVEPDDCRGTRRVNLDANRRIRDDIVENRWTYVLVNFDADTYGA